MSPSTLFKHTALAAAFALAGVNSATPAEVHSGNTEAMTHWYGRAGGLVGSDAVSEPKAWQQGRQSIQVTFSEALADWTNMPRKEAKVGPVTDSSGAVTQPASTNGTASAGLERYGRAGDAELLDQMQASQ